MKHANIAIFVPHIGCLHRCAFCNQNSISGAESAPTPADVRAACEVARKSLGERAKDAEIAFFGGSFTAIERGYMLALLKEAKACVDEMGFGGIRCSTRPDAVSDEVLTLLKTYGVTSIELGAQSLDDTVLSMNERGHTSAEVYDASRRIQAYGFSLGLQMMVGLYGDTPEKAVATVRGICTIRPDTVRIYPTIVMRGTELYHLYQAGEYTPLSLTEAVTLCAECLKLFNEHGINVIRLGLHSGTELQNGMAAGPYHPAFRELCESKLLLGRLLAMISEQGIKPGSITVRVAPKNLSKMLGQHKKNVEILSDMKYNLTVQPDDLLNENELAVSTTQPFPNGFRLT